MQSNTIRAEAIEEPFVYDHQKFRVRSHNGTLYGRMDSSTLYAHIIAGSPPTGNHQEDAALYAAQLVHYGLPTKARASTAIDILHRSFKVKSGTHIIHVPETIKDVERRLKKDYEARLAELSNIGCLTKTTKDLQAALIERANQEYVLEMINAQIQTLELQRDLGRRELLRRATSSAAHKHGNNRNSHTTTGSKAVAPKTPLSSARVKTMHCTSRALPEKVAGASQKCLTTESHNSKAAPRQAGKAPVKTVSCKKEEEAEEVSLRNMSVESVASRWESVETPPPSIKLGVYIHQDGKWERNENYRLYLTLPSNERDLKGSSISFTIPGLTGSAKCKFVRTRGDQKVYYTLGSAMEKSHPPLQTKTWIFIWKVTDCSSATYTELESMVLSLNSSACGLEISRRDSLQAPPHLFVLPVLNPEQHECSSGWRIITDCGRIRLAGHQTRHIRSTCSLQH